MEVESLVAKFFCQRKCTGVMYLNFSTGRFKVSVSFKKSVGGKLCFISLNNSVELLHVVKKTNRTNKS